MRTEKKTFVIRERERERERESADLPAPRQTRRHQAEGFGDSASRALLFGINGEICSGIIGHPHAGIIVMSPTVSRCRSAAPDRNTYEIGQAGEG